MLVLKTLSTVGGSCKDIKSKTFHLEIKCSQKRLTEYDYSCLRVTRGFILNIITLRKIILRK